MIHTDEDDEFARIEREAELRKGQPYHFTKRKDDDDDIQDYVRPWVGLTEDEAFACQGRDYFETYKAIEAKLKERNG